MMSGTGRSVGHRVSVHVHATEKADETSKRTNEEKERDTSQMEAVERRA